MGLFDFLKRRRHRNLQVRRFTAAEHSRWTDWVLSYNKIDRDLKNDYVGMTLRIRELAKNSEFVAGFLENAERNVIGAEGFSLQSKSLKFGKTIETLWREYNSRIARAVTLDECQSGYDFDCLVLRTLLIDGEVFIHREWDPENRFGWRYEVVDSLEVDPYYNVEDAGNGDRIIMGVKIDERGREKSFFIRRSESDVYMSGDRIEVPASQIIHIYRKIFPDQHRGISIFASVVANLAQLDGYKDAELVHARIQACTMGVWEWNGQSTGDMLDEVDEQGEFIREIKPGIFPVAPRGYSAKFLQNTSPNSQFASFWKNILRSVANALGFSYNKASGDYEAVNYSSLREATLEDRAAFSKIQRFFIENWKDYQFHDFITAIGLNGFIPLMTLAECRAHRFFGRRFSWVDPTKEIAAKEKEFDLLMTDPISELESRGIDPDELLDRWETWQKKLAARNIPFMVRPPVAVIEQNEGNMNER